MSLLKPSAVACAAPARWLSRLCLSCVFVAASACHGDDPPHDVEGDGGVHPSDAAGDGSSVARKLVFVTSARYDGNLLAAGAAATGPDSADALCKLAANGAQLGGSWRAWISSDTDNAIDRLIDVGPWYTVKGEKAFASKASVQQEPLVGLWLSEKGDFLPSDRIWTGTDYGGTTNSLKQTCKSWTSAAIGDSARIGQVGRSDTGAWTSYSSTSCNQQAHLICFQQ